MRRADPLQRLCCVKILSADGFQRASHFTDFEWFPQSRSSRFWFGVSPWIQRLVQVSVWNRSAFGAGRADAEKIEPVGGNPEAGSAFDRGTRAVKGDFQLTEFKIGHPATGRAD